MSRRSGKIRRLISRWFKERQIYHRSDGVVHFISMSTKTQIALAAVAGAAILWTAYASVNVVFKEQIIVARNSDYQIMERGLTTRINHAQRAYDDVTTLNDVMQQEFSNAMGEISARHQMLENTVRRNASITESLADFSDNLSKTGGPNGQHTSNGNRVMVDIAPGEVTPRQSRTEKLRKDAELEAMQRYATVGSTVSSDALETLRSTAADLYAEQILLYAAMEEKAARKVEDLKLILATTGIRSDRLLPSVAKISNAGLGQGGPFIDASIEIASPNFIQRANLSAASVDELAILRDAIDRVPLSSPLTGGRRFTSGFGIRRDPINGRRANHYGIDLVAARGAPISATASGVVKFAGVRSGFGRTVEIDHGNGFVTRYAHMRRISVKGGQKVKLHDKVGELGSSGRSTGPHIHYEIRYKKKPLNPSRFIEAGRYVFES